MPVDMQTIDGPTVRHLAVTYRPRIGRSSINGRYWTRVRPGWEKGRGGQRRFALTT